MNMAHHFLLLATSSGIALIVLGVGWLVVASLLEPAGRHAVSRQTRHQGWEGREDELHTFTVAFLLARNASPRWPVVDVDTGELPVVRTGVSV